MKRNSRFQKTIAIVMIFAMLIMLIPQNVYAESTEGQQTEHSVTPF